MNLQITTRHFDLTPELKTFAEERVRKLKRYFDHILEANLVLTGEKHRQLAELTLHLNSSDLMAQFESPDMRASIEQAVDRIEAQLKKHKDRIRDRKGRTGLGEALAAEGGASPGVEIEED